MASEAVRRTTRNARYFLKLWREEKARADAWKAHPNRPWNRGQQVLDL